MYKIGVLNGDYIGPEAMKEALKILKACSEKHGFAYETVMLEASGEAYDKYGESEIRRVAVRAFEFARKRKKKMQKILKMQLIRC